MVAVPHGQRSQTFSGLFFSFDLCPNCSLSLFFEACKLFARARIVFVHLIRSLNHGREKRESAVNCATAIVRKTADFCHFDRDKSNTFSRMINDN